MADFFRDLRAEGRSVHVLFGFHCFGVPRAYWYGMEYFQGGQFCVINEETTIVGGAMSLSMLFRLKLKRKKKCLEVKELM
ncbi:hypothetical protein EUGRSUZ_E04082 [Eucalyptus grandis]|uniref:Uncharacterized protein n=2 Tax=Eucalyptus grandis TaxID=71139 RepID=A0ACC3L0M4_EUCGR|nr:hypothetical protein EUGRSUZ_E04082 [Eucalyptus grandis]